MALFVLLSLAAVVFLYYQNQQLKGMLASYQTPVASPTPVATTDPTANWETYTNNVLSFKYPSDWSVAVGNSNAITYPKDTIVVKNSPSSFDINLVVQQNNSDPKATLTNFVKNTFGDFQTQIISSDSNTAEGYISQSGPEGTQLKITIKVIAGSQNSLIATTVLQEDKISIFNQLLSTFKFIGSEASSTPSASPSVVY